MSSHDIDPELAQAIWEAGKAAARHLGLGEPEYMTICGGGVSMQGEKTINWHKLTPAQRDETIHEKVMGHERKTVQYEVPSAREGETVFIASGTTWETGGLHIPRYSQSLDAACLAMEKMKQANWSRFCIELDGVITQHKRGWDESTGNPYVTWFQKFVKLLNADGICVAVLRTMGYEVLTEEAKL